MVRFRWLSYIAVASEVFGMGVELSQMGTDRLVEVSSRGSHSYCVVGESPGMGALCYRQFSDWSPGGPLFAPLLELAQVRAGDAALAGRRVSYMWYPDAAEAVFAYEGGLEVSQELFYAGPDLLVCSMMFRGVSQPLTLVFAGRATEGARASARGADGRVEVSVDAEMAPLYGEPHRLTERFTLALSPGPGCIEGGADRWRLEVPLAADGRVVLAACRGESLGLLEDALADPAAARRRTAESIRAWLAQAPPPATEDGARRVAYWRNWYWFWHNAEAAEGRWRYEIVPPSKHQYGRGIWLWDTGFHMLGLLTGGPEARELAKRQMLVLCENEVEGHLPREVWVDQANPQTQAPGILTWLAWRVYEGDGDKETLSRVYPVFARNNRWYREHKDPVGAGLCAWEWADSGWDTSPRFDAGLPLSVDLNCWLYLDARYLARMARELGRSGEAEEWDALAERTARLINGYFWDEEDGLYYDVVVKAGEFQKVKTPVSAWPLFVGVATREQAERVAAHFADPEEFWTAWPLPCVAADEPVFEPRNYWRGPTWINLNWVAIVGLRRYGFDALADELTERTLRLIERHPTPYEYYDPLTGEGLGGPGYMWTASFFVYALSGAEPPVP